MVTVDSSEYAAEVRLNPYSAGCWRWCHVGWMETFTWLAEDCMAAAARVHLADSMDERCTYYGSTVAALASQYWSHSFSEHHTAFNAALQHLVVALCSMYHNNQLPLLLHNNTRRGLLYANIG